MISAPTESVRIWHPIVPDERDAYGNKSPVTYALDHSELVGGVVVGDLAWEQEASERHPDGIVETVPLYLPKGCDGPFVGCKVTVRGHDYLVTEGHIYDPTGVPGPHNAWIRAVRRIGQ